MKNARLFVILTNAIARIDTVHLRLGNEMSNIRVVFWNASVFVSDLSRCKNVCARKADVYLFHENPISNISLTVLLILKSISFKFQ